MEEILKAFVEESLELLEEAGSCLLKLEREPEDLGLVNTVFRAFHTVKGSSALFELVPMTTLLHAGEDLLQSARESKFTLSADAIDVFLEALDTVRGWLQYLENNGRFPKGADEAVAPLLTKFAELGGGLTVVEEPVAVPTFAPSGERPAWLKFKGKIPEFFGEKLVAVEYEPEPDCFFCGDDPLRLVALIPELLHLELHFREPQPGTEEEEDPFRCALGLRIVAACPREELAALFAYVPDQVKLYEFSISLDPSVSLAIRALNELSAALEVPADEAVAVARRKSHAALGANVLLVAGFPLSWQQRMAEAAQQTLQTNSDEPLRQGLRDIDEFVSTAQRCAVRLSLIPELDIGSLDSMRAPGRRAPSRLSGPALAVSEVPLRAPLAAQRPGGQGSTSQVYKIDQERIDGLLELAGELLVAKNTLPYLARRADELCAAPQLAREIKDQASVLSRIAESFHNAVMQLRIIPLTHIFDRFPRLVRDVARKLGKTVRFEVVGEHTEADKSTVERLADPLIHVMRNSLDHGLENAEQRVACGKPAEGYIKLSAEQSRGALIVKVQDDGRGIDAQRVRQVALERGVITEAESQSLSDEQAIGLIFRAGFSTADTVSELSGRGVGMDVVRTGIESCGGSVQISSVLGEGTTVTMSLPLSMAVTRVLLVEVGGYTFGVPFDLVLETMHITPGQLADLRGRKVVAVRDGVVPVFALRDLLDLQVQRTAAQQEAYDSDPRLTMLLARTARGEVGIIVDAFQEALDVMLKPLVGPLAHLRGYLGSSLLGDGRALLVLNLSDLIHDRTGAASQHGRDGEKVGRGVGMSVVSASADGSSAA